MNENTPQVLTAGGAKKNVSKPQKTSPPAFALPPQKTASNVQKDDSSTSKTPGHETTLPVAKSTKSHKQEHQNNSPGQSLLPSSLEFEESENPDENPQHVPYSDNPRSRPYSDNLHSSPKEEGGDALSSKESDHSDTSDLAASGALAIKSHRRQELIWLLICFLGIMASFVCYGLLLEYATSGDEKLHELSFLFVTSGLYTLTAAAGRYVRDEKPTTIPPARFAVLGLTSMGSTFFSVRSLRYVIYPIQVLAKSCKPVPVMLMGALMGKSYPLKKYINVVLIVLGVALFMGGGDSHKDKSDEDGGDEEEDQSSPNQLIGILLLFISLCFDGGTGAYEDKLMSVHSVQPFDLMYNIQLGKTILAGIGLVVMNELHLFIALVGKMGPLLLALGLSGAMGQVFIFVTIAKFGALTCSIIGLARKVTTLVASIYFYGHSLNGIQATGLMISVGAMVLNFWGKKKGGGHGHGHGNDGPPPGITQEEMEKILDEEQGSDGDLEMEPLDTSNTKSEKSGEFA